MKRLIALALCLLFAVSLSACVKEGPVQTQMPAPVEELEEAGQKPPENQVYTQPPQEDAVGNVYILNYDPDTDGGWNAAAEAYFAQTGVEVRVLTASPEYYGETLAGELKKLEAPTLFYSRNPGEQEDSCLDLKDTGVYALLPDSGLAAVAGQKVLGIPVAAVEGEQLIWQPEAGYWCVNAAASQADAQATLAFISWALTDGLDVLFAAN